MRTAASIALLACLTLAATTCATRAPNRPATMQEMPAAPKPAPQAAAPAAQPEAGEPFVNQVVTLSFSLPENWEVVVTRSKYLTRIYFLGDNRGAFVIVTPYPTSDGMPEETVRRLLAGTERRGPARQVTSDDGKRSICFWTDHANAKSGAYAARVMKEDGRVSAVIMGSWPLKRDSVVRKLFADIVDSVKYE
jgi:hypothetical protein